MGYNQSRTGYPAYSAYKETGVKTASQGKLVVMLYEEAVRQLDIAISRFGQNNKIETCDIEKFGKNIIKTQEIITELMVSLNMEAGGDIAKNLMALYTYFNRELLNANINQDKEKIAFIRDEMNQLKEAWIVAANTTPAVPPMDTQRSVDIEF